MTRRDFICDLLVKYQEHPNVEAWLQSLFETHPQLINHLKESQVISERMDQLEQNLVDLAQQRDALEREIEEKTQAVQSTDQAAIEAKKQTLLDMDDEYLSRSNQLEMVVQSLGIANNISELQKKQQYLQEQVKYHERHKKNLENENPDLQRQFLELTSKQHEKMLGIAFDGFMSSKLLNAAAQWEKEKADEGHDYFFTAATQRNPCKIISWSSLEDTFVLPDSECRLSTEIQKIYDSLLMHLRKKLFTINYRVDAAIRQYWAVASKRFENDETGTDAAIVALDYAIAQRILPKIIGDGEEFERWLEDFRSLCSKHALNMSAEIIKGIIERGNQRMKYYQFFS